MLKKIIYSIDIKSNDAHARRVSFKLVRYIVGVAFLRRAQKLMRTLAPKIITWLWSRLFTAICQVRV